MTEYTGWIIKTGFHGEDLFADTDGVDVDESITKYAEMLTAAIEAQYPGAEVEVDYDKGVTGVRPHNLKTRVFPPGDVPNDEDEESMIDDIAGRIFEEFEWLVYDAEKEAE